MAIPNITPPTGAWKTVQELVKDTVGPMAVLGAAASAFVKATAGAALNAEKLRRALAASSEAEKLRGQFQALGLSAEQAKAKVEGLAKAASSSAFSFEALGQASKNLMAVGGAAADSAAMLKKVQDVAAASGAPVDAVATAMAQLYSQAGKDQSLSGAAQGLASLGAISAEAAAKVQGLAAAGAPAADGLRLIEGELAKSKGAGAALAGTLVGLQAQLANLQSGNDAKIGDLFLEGEKAGLRAAIAFEKVRGVIDETASAPFAAISEGLNKLKEALGGALSSEGGLEKIKGFFVFLSTAAVATLGVLAAQVALFAAAILKAAAAVVVKTGALNAASVAGAKWLSFLNTAAGRANLYAAALALVAVKAWETVAAINASAKAMDELSKANAKQIGDNNKMTTLASTPEEKKAAADSLDAQIRENDERLKKAQEERAAAKDRKDAAFDTFLGISKGSMFERAGAEANLEAKDAEVTEVEKQGRRLRGQRDRLVAREAGGLTEDQDKQERDRIILEDNIRKQAVSRMQAAMSPQAALEMAQGETARAREKVAQTQADSKAAFKERTALNDAQIEMIGSREDPKKFAAALDKMQGLQPTSEVGKLSQDVAMRETLLAELGQAQADTGAGVEGAAEREQLIRKRIADQYGGGDFDAGLNEIRGASTQDVKRRRDEAIRKGDPNDALASLDVKKQNEQSLAEAAAADKAAEDAGKRKLAIQKQLAALQGVEGGDGKAAEMELGPEIKQLQEKLKAVQELEAAQTAYNEALGSGDQKKIDAAGADVNAKRVTALGAGAQAGDTSASVGQELQGVTQILEIRKQQAAVEQAAAQARRDEIMQELRLRQQISQLAFSNATGTTGKKGGQSETDLRIADVQRTRSRAEEAQALVAEREALRESGGSTDELDKRIAELGFDKNTNSQDIQSAIKGADIEELNLRGEQVAANREVARNAKIQSLSMQEKFAPTREAREDAKKLREEAEDEAATEAKTKDYSRTMDPKLAGELAARETELDRLRIQDEESGTPRVDSLTAVGGGATGFIGSSPVDIQKSIKQKTDELAKTLEKVYEALGNQTKLGESINTKLDNE